jgi:Cytochrome P450
VDFYKDGGHDTASPWVQGATKISDQYGISELDKARMDIANARGVIVNSSPSAFWTLYHIFSDQSVLDEVRAALTPLLESTTIDGSPNYELDVSHIRDVPILKSVFHEALRHYANGKGTRKVVEDMDFGNGYNLKKGTFIFIPNRPYHFHEPTWGPTVNDFDPHRFMNIKTPRGAYLPFGGGQSLCPGRFFAQNQILSMCAMMALRYDIGPRSGGWVHPGVDDIDPTLIVHPPNQKMFVDVLPRDGLDKGTWTFKV